MKETEVMELLESTDAYQHGHFQLSSGLHSGSYLQCALLLQNPIVAERICGVLASKFKGDEPDVVIGPAMGGIVLAYELARALGARALFTERNSEGKMALRRGFVATAENKVLIAEDVLTTGTSVKEVIEHLGQDGITPVGVACIVDRSAGLVNFGGIRHESLLKLNIPTFEPENCPLCKEGVPLLKPGSRK